MQSIVLSVSQAIDASERIPVHSVLIDSGYDFVQIGFKFACVCKSLLCEVHLIKDFSSKACHPRHVFLIKSREVVRVGKGHIVKAVGKAAHEIPFASGLLRSVVKSCIEKEVLACLVIHQGGLVFCP